jgi:Holliday junction resolvase RusA-like endonuclease
MAGRIANLDPEPGFICWGVMPGRLCSKSNRRRVVKFGNRTAVIKSQESQVYTDSFIRLFRCSKPFLEPVSLIAHVYYRDMRPDLDIALLQDCLQAAGIIKNDRQVVEIHAYRHLDKLNPRTVFKLLACPSVHEDPGASL